MRKKHECRKGVSPAIGVIILIALTVAAVGMVAVILSTIGTPMPAPIVTFGNPDAYAGPAQSDNTDYSAVIDLPMIGGQLNMMDLKVYYTCYVFNYLNSGNNVTVTYTAQLGNDGVKSVCSVAPPAPAEGVPPSDTTGVYAQYYGTPVRSAGDKISFFFQSDSATDTSQLLPSVIGSTVTVKLVHMPSNITIYEGTIMTRAKVWDGPSQPPETSEVEIWVSSEDGSYKLTKVVNETVEPLDNSPVNYTFNIDPTVTYQSILGFGSSLESSSCYNLSRLDNSVREGVIENLVNPNVGIGMNLMRICIGTSDFTGENWYTYDDVPDGQTDPNLDNFTIEKDNEYIIPAIKIALAKNPDLKIFASPWSPPAWMKDSESITGGSLLREYYDVYARYFVKFIRAYEAQGISIYAVTVQNEPGFEWVGRHPSCRWTWEEERDFVKGYLGPAFESEGIYTKIWIYDWNFDRSSWPDSVLDDPSAASYIDGTAFHHYGGEPTAMTYLHQNHPDEHIYFTEGSTYGTSGALQIISYLRNWAESYNAWVTLLDEGGMPNNGPFPSDPELKCIVLRNDMSLDYTYQYFMYGQFMKFIPRGALRILSDAGDSVVSNVAFKNPSSEEVVFVIANASDYLKSFKIVYGDSMIKTTTGPRSTATLKWIP